MCAAPCSKQIPTSACRPNVHLSSELAFRSSEGFAVSLQMSILGTQGSNRALTQPMTVTAADSHAITELNRRAAMDEVRLCMKVLLPPGYTLGFRSCASNQVHPLFSPTCPATRGQRC